jgi:hypothetical protein
MKEALSSISTTVLIPALTTIASVVLVFISNYVKKAVESFQAKNDLEQLKKLNEIKTTLLDQIETVTKSVVASKMQIALGYKKENTDGHLTDEQSTELKTKAKEEVLAMLPNSLTEDDGSLLSIIGSKEKLNLIIDSFIEKYVYEYNNK